MQWWCLCDCQLKLPQNDQKLVLIKEYDLTNGKRKSCGCMRNCNLVGQKFGKLTVLEYIKKYKLKNGNVYPRWKCICDCQLELPDEEKNIHMCQFQIYV